MKRIISFVILHLSFVIFCPSTNAQWEGAEVQRLTYDDVPEIGQELKITITSGDKLHLIYLEGIRDSATGSVYEYKLMSSSKDKDGEWSQPEEIGNRAAMGWGDMEPGHDPSSGMTHIVYAKHLSLSYDTMYYTSSEVPGWELVKIDSLSEEYNARFEHLSMAFDSLGNVHLVWHVDFDSTGSSWYRLMYANNSSGEWAKQEVSEAILLGGTGSGASYLTVQRNGTAHIVYHRDGGGSNIPYYYARNDSLSGEDWHSDTIPRPNRPFVSYGGGPIEVDANDGLHLITGGCIAQECIEPGHHRTFYYYREIADTVWTGPEQIPDTTFGSRFRIEQLLVDESGIPYASYLFSSNEVYFTNRKQGNWQVPSALVGWQEDSDSLLVDAFAFVLDSEGQGHGVLIGWDIRHVFHNDSAEVYYLSCSNSAVDTSLEVSPLDFKLSQNYPNPFNSSTIIHYQTSVESNMTLRVYDILGREVKELANRIHKQGHYRLVWHGRNNEGKEVASGIYFYQLKGGEQIQTKRMLLVK